MNKINKLKQFSFISIMILSSFLLANSLSVSNLSLYPLNSNLISKSRGGSINDNVAINDGIGTILIGGLNINHNLSNTPMNNLILNNKDLINEGHNITDLIDDNIITNTNGDLININNNPLLLPSGITDGTPCDDNNPQTINDIYTNGICSGTNVEGNTCDDGNVQTINDIYTNGVCTGTNVEGQSCTINGMVNTTYHNGVCQGGNLVGDTCDDGNIQTINDVWLSDGTCAGTNVEGQSCDDNNLQTTNDTYHNGVCSGTNNEGQSCNDGNVQTINDIYHNGVCSGTNVEGQSCTKTNYINTTYHNGVCSGGNLIGDTCDDGNSNTINDKWVYYGTTNGHPYGYCEGTVKPLTYSGCYSKRTYSQAQDVCASWGGRLPKMSDVGKFPTAACGTTISDMIWTSTIYYGNNMKVFSNPNGDGSAWTGYSDRFYTQKTICVK